MNSQKQWRLVGDIGGTNARFALNQIGSDDLRSIEYFAVKDYKTFLDALTNYFDVINKQGITKEKLHSACFAVACPADEENISFTNSHWIINQTQTRAFLEESQVFFINDFTAVAYAVNNLKESDYIQLGSGVEEKDKAKVILGPGTGLGVSSIAHTKNGPAFIPGEGGHIAFAPLNNLEIEILKYLQTKFSRVSVERLLSGEGIVNIYNALCAIEKLTPEYTTPAEIIGDAVKQQNNISHKTADVFLNTLGSVAGDLALVNGAKGGVYLAGGILPRMLELLETSEINNRFEEKGRFKELMSNIPLRMLTKEHIGLFGVIDFLKINSSENQ